MHYFWFQDLELDSLGSQQGYNDPLSAAHTKHFPMDMAEKCM